MYSVTCSSPVNLRSGPKSLRHDETVQQGGAKLTHFLFHVPPRLLNSIKMTLVRQYAGQNQIEEQATLVVGMNENAEEFLVTHREIYKSI